MARPVFQANLPFSRISPLLHSPLPLSHAPHCSLSHYCPHFHHPLACPLHLTPSSRWIRHPSSHHRCRRHLCASTSPDSNVPAPQSNKPPGDDKQQSPATASTSTPTAALPQDTSVPPQISTCAPATTSAPGATAAGLGGDSSMHSESFEEHEEGEEWEQYEKGEFGGEEEEEAEEMGELGPYTGPTELFYEEGKFLEVGGIANAHGVRGEVKVYPVTDSPGQRFRTGSRLWLQPFTSKLQKNKVPLKRVTVESGRPSINKQGTIWLVKLKETSSRTEALMLKRAVLWVARSDLPPLKKGELYLSDLVGMKVVHQGTGEEVGELVDVFADLAPYETIQVKLTQTTADIQAAQYRSVLVPLVPAICPIVDRDKRVIELDAPEGLLDLVSVTRLGKKKISNNKNKGKAMGDDGKPMTLTNPDSSS